MSGQYEWLSPQKWTKGKEPPGWQKPRISNLLHELEGLGREDEQKFEQICLLEVEACYAHEVSNSSLKNNITFIRKAIAIHFQGKLNENNSYIHPTRHEREHISLLHIDTPQEIKDQNNFAHLEALEWKHQNVAYINNPQAIVERATELLDKAIAAHEEGEFCNFRDLGAGLALLAGLRPIEILKTAVLKPKSQYTLIMAGGQAKTRGEKRVYEMPTLIEADKVLQGYHLLREIFDASDLSDHELGSWKNGIRDHVILNFSELVPSLYRGSGEKQVNTQRLRAVYDAIAVFYYCPPNIKDFVYVKAINGHKPEKGKSGAAMHYLDYAIADEVIAAHGGKRQGVKLKELGVEVLSMFKPKKKQATKTAPKGKTKYASVRVTAATKKRFEQWQKKRGLPTQEETVKALLEGSLQPEPKPTEADITPKSINLEPLVESLLADAMKLSGEEDFGAFLKVALEKEIKFRIGLTKRHEGKDFVTLPLSELKKMRHGEASQERIRRAFLAIKHHNSAIATDKSQRWYINANSLHQLVGGRFGTLTPWVEQHRDEIESHNQVYELTEADNRKPIKIDAMVTVPEFPED